MNIPITAMTPYGPMSFPYIYPYNMGSPGPASAPSYVPGSYTGSGYITGGSYSGFDPLGIQSDLAAAQQAAAKVRKNMDDARDLIDAQWAYEKLGVTGKLALTGAQEQAVELQKALNVKDESEIASGASLNRILLAIVIAEGKGAKGIAAYLPPRLLDEIRFKGGPAADLMNMVRQSGRIPFPSGFPGPSLDTLQAPLEADFAAAIAPLLAGKQVDPTKVTKLEASLKKLEVAAQPVIRDMAFDDAIATRRFLNQFESAVKALKSTTLTGLINPKWATDGISVADLTKHMTKFKMMFAPAPAGGEGSYLTLHKAMVTYLFVLNNAQVKK